MKRASTLLAALAVTLAACGGAGDTSPTTSAPEATQAPSTTVAAPTNAPTTVAPTPAPTAPTTTTVPTTTAAPTTTPAPSTTVAAVDLESVLAGSAVDGWYPVQPARYASDRVSPAITIDVVEPLWFQDAKSLIILRDNNAAGDPAVFITNFYGIIPAEDVGTHPPHRDDPIPENTVDMPAVLGDWIAATPQVVLMNSGSVTVMGSPAEYWDVTVDATAGTTFECPYGNCVAAMVSEVLGNFVMGDNSYFRIYQLSGGGAGIYVWAEAPAYGFEAISLLAEKIMAGFSLS